MIRAIVGIVDPDTQLERKVIFFGLSKENILRIVDEKPLHVNLRNIDPEGPPVDGMPDLDIVIMIEGPELLRFLGRTEPGPTYRGDAHPGHEWGPSAAPEASG